MFFRIFIVAKFGGFWIYPFFALMNDLQRNVFFAVSLLYLVSLYKVSEIINNKIFWKEATPLSKHKVF